MRGREEKYVLSFAGKTRRKETTWKLVLGAIILKCIKKKEMRLWIGIMWLRTDRSSKLL
jgi:hypothetical protein